MPLSLLPPPSSNPPFLRIRSVVSLVAVKRRSPLPMGNGSRALHAPDLSDSTEPPSAGYGSHRPSTWISWDGLRSNMRPSHPTSPACSLSQCLSPLAAGASLTVLQYQALLHRPMSVYIAYPANLTHVVSLTPRLQHLPLVASTLLLVYETWVFCTLTYAQTSSNSLANQRAYQGYPKPREAAPERSSGVSRRPRLKAKMIYLAEEENKKRH